MMPITRSQTNVTVSLLLSYLLIILLCTPFTVSGGSSRTKSRSTQEQAPARYRDGELLVRFRDGVSKKDKDTIIAAQGARRK